MSDTQAQTQLEDLSREDLIRLVKRATFVKEQQSSRIGSILSENLELMGVIQELQAELQALKPSTNGEVPPPEVPVDVTS